MRYLIFADIHANLFAFEEIIKFKNSNNIDSVLFLGDVVGYNSFPNECIELLIKNEIPSIKGNHEALLLNDIPFYTTGKIAQKTIKKTRELITSQNLEFIKQLPLSLTIENHFELIHASFKYIDEKINSIKSAKNNFLELLNRELEIAFIGHTHKPAVYCMDNNINQINDIKVVGEFQLENGMKYIISPGSAGDSRYGLPYSFVVYDSGIKMIEFQKIELSDEKKAILHKNNYMNFGKIHVSKFDKKILRIIRRMVRIKRKYYA